MDHQPERENRVLDLDGTGGYVGLRSNTFQHLDEPAAESWVKRRDFGGHERGY